MTRRRLAPLILFTLLATPLLCFSQDPAAKKPPEQSTTSPEQSTTSPEQSTTSKDKSFKDWLRGRAETREDETGFFPQFGTITGGSGLAGGVRFAAKYLEVSSLLSVRGYHQYDLKIGIRPPRGGIFIKSLRPSDVFQFAGIEEKEPGFFGYLHGRYRNFPREDFYGIGTDTPPVRTDFKLTEASYYAVGGYQIKETIRFDFRAGLLKPDLGRGRDDNFPNLDQIYTDAEVPGLLQASDFLHVKSAFVIDYRDQPHNSHAGVAFGLTFNRYFDLDDNDFSFNRFAVDARLFKPVYTERNLVALRLLTSLDVPTGDSRVPFYLMETLGGGYTLRGYTDYRFRDTKQLHVTIEYRWEVKNFVEAAAFYDTGKVFHNMADWDFQNLKNSYGIGVRFKTSKRVLFRFDVARSNEDTRFLMKFGPAF